MTESLIGFIESAETNIGHAINGSMSDIDSWLNCAWDDLKNAKAAIAAMGEPHGGNVPTNTSDGIGRGAIVTGDLTPMVTVKEGSNPSSSTNPSEITDNMALKALRNARYYLSKGRHGHALDVIDRLLNTGDHHPQWAVITLKPCEDDFEAWYNTNGYYHDTVSDRKELMREAWLASKATKAVGDETLSDVVDEYLHWRKVNPHIKGGENYLKRLRAATPKPVSSDLAKLLVSADMNVGFIAECMRSQKSPIAQTIVGWADGASISLKQAIAEVLRAN